MFVRNRCYTIVAYAYALPLLLVLSPWAAFVPGSCSPVCTPCRYSYRRGLCSHRGHVRPQSLLYYCGYCVHPGTIAIAVGYVRTGVMFTRVYTLSLVLSPWVMFASGSCTPVVAVVACHCRGWKPWCYCCSTSCQCPVSPHGLYPARQTGTVVRYVHTCQLLSIVVFRIGSCSWCCAERRSLPFVRGCNPVDPTHTTPMGIVCNYQQPVGGRISTLRWTSLSALVPRSVLFRHERSAGCTTVAVESIEYDILRRSHTYTPHFSQCQYEEMKQNQHWPSGSNGLIWMLPARSSWNPRLVSLLLSLDRLALRDCSGPVRYDVHA